MRVLDIFCGGGGSSYGARKAGAEIVCGIDLDTVAAKTFKINFPNACVINGKLENVKLGALRERVGKVDLLLASPECTNHTCAKGSAPRSEESRATAMQVIRFARAFTPRWIILENVIHMRPWSRYGELKEKLVGLGYCLKEMVLDASDFGVGQKRRRLFIVAGKGRLPGYLPPSKNVKAPPIKELLDKPNVWKTTPLYGDGRAAATIERAERGFASVGRQSAFLIVYYGSDGSGGWQSLDRPLRTITTVDRFALVEPGKGGPTMRMLQVPELQRAMGFENDYKLEGSRRQKIKILGNGVCPPVMQALVENLKAHL